MESDRKGWHGLVGKVEGLKGREDSRGKVKPGSLAALVPEKALD